MVFALGEHRDIVLLDDRRVLSQLDQLQVHGVGIICNRYKTEKETRLDLFNQGYRVFVSGAICQKWK